MIRNEYEVKGSVATIFIKHKQAILHTTVESSDLELLNEFNNSWYVNEEGGRFYVYSRFGGKPISLHRFLMKPTHSKMVDHKNHDTLDNRRENLRIVTRTQNQQNRKGAAKHNKIGVRGVSLHKGKYMARITVNKKPMYLGLYSTLEEANEVVCEARANLFGEFSL